MSPKSIEEYTVIFVKRYKRVNYNQKKIILNEYCKVTKYHRKHAIRKLNNFRLFVKKKASLIKSVGSRRHRQIPKCMI